MSKVDKRVSEATLEEMCTDKFKFDFANMLRCRYPLFYITHNEERRLIQFLNHFCVAKGYDCYVWDTLGGLIKITDGEEVAGSAEDLKNNPIAILDYIISEGRSFEKKKDSVTEKKNNGCNGIIYVLLDYFNFIQPNPDIERRLVAISNLNTIVSTILTGPYYQTTDAIKNIIPTMEFPYANNNEIRQALYAVVKGAERKIPDIVKKTKEIEETLIGAVSGLTLQEAQTAFSKSLVSGHDWNISYILEEKKQLISKSDMLEFFDKTVSIEEVGGLKNLVKWIKDRRECFSKEAEDYGIKKPRGLLTIGMPGCVVAGTKIKVKKISKEGNHEVYEK